MDFDFDFFFHFQWDRSNMLMFCSALQLGQRRAIERRTAATTSPARRLQPTNRRRARPHTSRPRRPSTSIPGLVLTMHLRLPHHRRRRHRTRSQHPLPRPQRPRRDTLATAWTLRRRQEPRRPTLGTQRRQHGVGTTTALATTTHRTRPDEEIARRAPGEAQRSAGRKNESCEIHSDPPNVAKAARIPRLQR